MGHKHPGIRAKWDGCPKLDHNTCDDSVLRVGRSLHYNERSRPRHGAGCRGRLRRAFRQCKALGVKRHAGTAVQGNLRYRDKGLRGRLPEVRPCAGCPRRHDRKLLERPTIHQKRHRGPTMEDSSKRRRHPHPGLRGQRPLRIRCGGGRHVMGHKHPGIRAKWDGCPKLVFKQDIVPIV